jgi:ribonuclease D
LVATADAAISQQSRPQPFEQGSFAEFAAAGHIFDGGAPGAVPPRRALAAVPNNSIQCAKQQNAGPHPCADVIDGLELSWIEGGSEHWEPLGRRPAGGPETGRLTLIASAPAVEVMLAQLGRCGAVGLDIEAQLGRSFYGSICTLQLSAAAHGTFLVDCLEPAVRVALSGGLRRLTEDPAVLKLMHGGDSDVQWLQRDFGAGLVRPCAPRDRGPPEGCVALAALTGRPTTRRAQVNAFDTQCAAEQLNARLGPGERLPLKFAELSSRLLGAPLTQKMAQEDWTQRPLPLKMAYYAAADAHYLPPLAQELWVRLAAIPGALAATEAASRAICKIQFVRRVPADTAGGRPWSNDKGFRKALAGHKLPRAVETELVELYLWRDHQARDQDVHPNTVCPKHRLVALAFTRADAEHPEEIEQSVATALSRVESELQERTEAARRRLEAFKQAHTERAGPAALELEPELDACERLCYHLACQQLGLGHLSHGSGRARRLRVWIRAQEPEPEVELESAQQRKPQIQSRLQQLQIQPRAPVPSESDGTYKAVHMLLLDGSGKTCMVRDAKMQRKADRDGHTAKSVWTNIGGKVTAEDGSRPWATLRRVARQKAGLDLADAAAFRPVRPHPSRLLAELAVLRILSCLPDRSTASTTARITVYATWYAHGRPWFN